MAQEILMPRQGNTVESCLILEWHKEEGQSIQAGEVLCEVETDKAAFEIESEESGTVLKLLFPEGEDVAVLSPIAIIGEPDEEIGSLLAATSADELSQEAPPSEEILENAEEKSITVSEANLPTPSTNDAQRISPRARHLAAARGVEVSSLSGSGPGGRTIERDVLAALGDRAPLTPAARTAMLEQGIQAPKHGTGIGGRVTTADLQQTQTVQAVPATTMEFPGSVTDIPVKGVRKIIASRMLDSLQNTAQLTMNASADASALLAYRKRLKQAPEELGLAGVTINDFVLYAVAGTLLRFSFMNAHFLGESIREFTHVHLGMAVDSERGLMVPVIKHADSLSLKELSGEATRLGTASKAGTLAPDEMSGATFTITNLGSLGIESFTPVLNPPEVAILGVCAIQPKPVFSDENISYVPHISLSLTFDHRAVDGAPAARFLKELCTALANFDLLLAG